MEKLKMHSTDLTGQNVVKLMELFPNCVTESRNKKGDVERVIDFDVLRQELSDRIVEGPEERYHLNWPGKREAQYLANSPIAKTLRPCREESVDFDNTENLFIEGDNLDALKLLQDSYLGKVKMIYIDPPYNTGNDFIYQDNFSQGIDEFLKKSNQKDKDGNRLVANTESNGRYHSDWLSMMYPRLRLSRNLLKDDGVIFISIDDNEVDSLKKICDEVFGSQNYIASVIWQRAFAPKNDAKFLSQSHDYILIYSKNSNAFEAGRLERSEKTDSRYSNPDNDKRGAWVSGDLTVKTYSEKYDYEITTPSNRTVSPSHGSCWRVSREKFEELRNDNRIWFGKDGNNVPRLKRFLSEVQNGIVPTTLWLHTDVGHNQEGRQELKKLFDDKGFFDGPKPIRLISRILRIANTEENDIILDFYAGSSTTAHAVLKQNLEDGVNRKFIMVQVPENCNEKSEAFKAGYKNIAEISKERIRRAGKQIVESLDAKIGKIGEESKQKGLFESQKNETDRKKLDIGFRVLKIDSSNMQDIYYSPAELQQGKLKLISDNIKQDRSEEDLLFQVLIDWGVDLSLPTNKENIMGLDVFFVDNNSLIACFVKGGKITEEFVKELAKYKPLRVVFRDAGFKSDDVKINVKQVFKLISPNTEVRTI